MGPIKKGQYKLKKDTPKFKAGSIFSVDSENTMWGPNGGYYAVLDEDSDDSIRDFDEWFEEVGVKWPRYGDEYYYLDSAGEVSPSVVFSHSRLLEGRREIGNTFKTRNAICQFARFLKAMEVIRHDEGFMKRGDDTWTVTYNSDNELVVQCVIGTYREYAGMVYFDTPDHARKSINEHPFEWHDILGHDWSKGEDEEEDED